MNEVKSGIKGITESNSDLRRISVNNITVVLGRNRRSPEVIAARAEELAPSIEEFGVRQTCRGHYDSVTGKFALTDGECRYRGALIVQAKTGMEIFLPCVSEAKEHNEGDYLVSQLISNAGLPLTAQEQAEVIRALHNYGWGVEKIAKACVPAKTTSQVSALLTLSSATPATRELIKNGAVEVTTVVNEIKTAGNADKAHEVIEQAVVKAKSEGKKKATGKDAAAIRNGTAPKAASKNDEAELAETVLRIWRQIFPDLVREEDGRVKFSNGDWEAISSLLES